MDFYAAGPRFLGRFRHNIGSSLADLLYLPPFQKKQREKALRAFVECKARWTKLKNLSTVECIIFSKDRALQLHGLLSTFREKVFPVVPAHVLYMASSPSHQKAYDDVIDMFGKQNVRFIQQKNNRSFKHDLMEILFSLTCDMLFFLVDDILLTEPVDLNDVLKLDPDVFVPSLRMGQNLTHCYVLQRPQALPHFLDPPVSPSDKIVWQWEKGELDWGYPLSVDGHFFARREMTAMARSALLQRAQFIRRPTANIQAFFYQPPRDRISKIKDCEHPLQPGSNGEKKYFRQYPPGRAAGTMAKRLSNGL